MAAEPDALVQRGEHRRDDASGEAGAGADPELRRRGGPAGAGDGEPLRRGDELAGFIDPVSGSRADGYSPNKRESVSGNYS